MNVLLVNNVFCNHKSERDFQESIQSITLLFVKICLSNYSKHGYSLYTKKKSVGSIFLKASLKIHFIF